MTKSTENGENKPSKDPLKIAVVLLIVVAVIMLAFLVKNCVTDSTRNFPPAPETEEANINSDSESEEAEIIN